jgi:phosphoglycerol transferase MdoB-like AlkP superfamily enzyme
MAATIRSRSRVLRPRVNPGDLYLARVVKYIPTEVIMAYVASIGFVKTLAGTQQRLWSWLIAISLLVLTPVWTMRAASVTGQPTPTHQVIAATVAFAAWTFATGGPFEQFQWYTRALGSIVLILTCLCLPIVEWLVPDSILAKPSVRPDERGKSA